ncbi:MAG TPA: TonB family protein [Candidatus Alistipes merdigallinarum]|nr:TonB family protein [Candidatus Alistipes merdigallinarum]
MSNEFDLNSKQWCELVFDGKNQEFGAYRMRESSTSRHNKAMLIVFVVVILVLTLPKLIRYVVPEKEVKIEMTQTVQLEKLPPPEVKNNDVIKKAEAAPPPPLKSTIKFTAPKIVKDEEVGEEDVKTQDELLSSSTAISVADVKGNDDEFGMDIADVGEIALDTPQEEEEEEIFMSAEQPPMFPGGMEALMKYLNDNIIYPVIALENGVSGTVVLKFVVSKTGKIDDIQVVNSVDRALDEEAVRVVSQMPDWQPAKQNGNNVAVYFNLPVRFVIGQK